VAYPIGSTGAEGADGKGPWLVVGGMMAIVVALVVVLALLAGGGSDESAQESRSAAEDPGGGVRPSPRTGAAEPPAEVTDRTQVHSPGSTKVTTVFGDFDVSDFWKQSEYATETYVDDPLTDEKVAAVERALGYTLPKAYVELMKSQNGGFPRKTNHRTKEPTSWAKDHVAITGIYSIGSAKPHSLCGDYRSQFWVGEWGYPPIGVYFADCPSAGHDMLCLDYRECGPTGEPRVVHVAQGYDYRITLVAEDFESFIRGLEGDEAFEE